MTTQTSSQLLTAKIETSPYRLMMSIVVTTVETAKEIAARFPKSYGVKATTLTRPIDHTNLDLGWERVGYVLAQAYLDSDGVNGGKNETGLARFAKIEAKLATMADIEVSR